MERVTYEYQKFTGVSGGDSIMNKIYSFAIAQGWTSAYYQTNKSWNRDEDGQGGYLDSWGWQDYGILEDHMELSSPGYGNADHAFRFYNNQYDGTQHRLYMRAIEAGLHSINNLTSTAPHGQNDWTYTSDFGYLSVPASSFPEMAIIGNDKVIIVVLFVNSFISLAFGFGTYELIPEYQNTTELQWHQHQADISGGSWAELSDPSYNGITYWHSFLGQSYYHTWWEGRRSLGSSSWDVRPMCRVNRVENISGNWFTGSGMIATNTFSGYRTLYSIPILCKNAADGTWNHIGHYPHYYIKWAGLTWGDIITRGTDNYIVFPNFYTYGDYGVAIKVNVP